VYTGLGFRNLDAQANGQMQSDYREWFDFVFCALISTSIISSCSEDLFFLNKHYFSINIGAPIWSIAEDLLNLCYKRCLTVMSNRERVDSQSEMCSEKKKKAVKALGSEGEWPFCSKSDWILTQSGSWGSNYPTFFSPPHSNTFVKGVAKVQFCDKIQTSNQLR
jgi:hypothetical protein